MTTSNVKVSTLRAQSNVCPKAIERIESADGMRWATSRAYKVSTGFGRYDIVVAWTLKQRVNGKIVTVSMHRSKDAADAFVASVAA